MEESSLRYWQYCDAILIHLEQRPARVLELSLYLPITVNNLADQLHVLRFLEGKGQIRFFIPPGVDPLSIQQHEVHITDFGKTFINTNSYVKEAVEKDLQFTVLSQQEQINRSLLDSGKTTRGLMWLTFFITLGSLAIAALSYQSSIGDNDLKLRIRQLQSTKDSQEIQLFQRLKDTTYVRILKEKKSSKH